MLGGQWNGEATRTATISAYQAERAQLLIFKVLWRMGFAECRTKRQRHFRQPRHRRSVPLRRPAAVRKAHGTDLYRIATNVTRCCTGSTRSRAGACTSTSRGQVRHRRRGRRQV